MVILQQLDEGLHLRRIEIKLDTALGRFDQTRNCIGVLDVGEEIQDEEIDMLDFVVAELDTLRGSHFGRDVSADAEAIFVGFVDDGGHEARA